MSRFVLTAAALAIVTGCQERDKREAPPPGQEVPAPAPGASAGGSPEPDPGATPAPESNPAPGSTATPESNPAPGSAPPARTPAPTVTGANPIPEPGPRPTIIADPTPESSPAPTPNPVAEPSPESGTPAIRCGVGGTPIAADQWRTCKGVIGGPCCYQTEEQACSGAGCAGDKCALAKSRPPKAICRK